MLGYLDLNYLKKINDCYGHQTGDAVLQETARRLREALGKDAFLARIGGDEFIAILPHTFASREAITRISSAIKNAMSREFLYQNCRLALSISAGFAVYPEDAEDIETLARLSDQAMYWDKQRMHQADARREKCTPGT